MAENNLSDFLNKKAYQISYAASRVAGVSRKGSFMEALEREGFSFLASAVKGDYEATRKAGAAIEYLLRLGGDIGSVNPANARIIIAEIKSFDSAIAESEKAAISEQIDLESVFSKLPVPAVTAKENSKPLNSSRGMEKIGNGSDKQAENANGGGIIKVAMRQSAILERIKQNGNCRMKEIQEALPETSERTIRYDLQTLLEQGSVERIGNGGPATFYKVRAISG